MRAMTLPLLCLLLPPIDCLAETAIADPALEAVKVQAVQGPNRYLQFELIVPASLDALWSALTDSAALASWAGPAAHVEPVRDGAWDIYFNPAAPKGERGSENRLLAVVPRRMLVIEAGAPAQFPSVKAQKTLAIFELEALTERQTRVRMTQTGWKDGAEWDAAYNYLAQANRLWLSWLYERFTVGPKRWPQASETREASDRGGR